MRLDRFQIALAGPLIKCLFQRLQFPAFRRSMYAGKPSTRCVPDRLVDTTIPTVEFNLRHNHRWIFMIPWNDMFHRQHITATEYHKIIDQVDGVCEHPIFHHDPGLPGLQSTDLVLLILEVDESWAGCLL